MSDGSVQLMRFHAPGRDEWDLWEDSDWYTHRDSYLTYGDDYRLVDSWSGEKQLNSRYVLSAAKGYAGTELRSYSTKHTLRLKISGKRYRGKLIPHWWYIQLEMGGYTLHPERPKNWRSARSISQIERLVDKMDFTSFQRELEQKFYSPRRAHCLYTMVDGSWQPFLTTFISGGWNDAIPSGEYLHVQIRWSLPAGKFLVEEIMMSKLSVGYWGYSGAGITAEFHGNYPRGWFPPELVQEARNELKL